VNSILFVDTRISLTSSDTVTTTGEPSESLKLMDCTGVFEIDAFAGGSIGFRCGMNRAMLSGVTLQF
jgi:hypothetical protein